MGGASIFVVLVAAGAALPVSLLIFGIGPTWLRCAFLRYDRTWRRFGRLGLFSALAAIVLLALLVPPRHVF